MKELAEMEEGKLPQEQANAEEMKEKTVRGGKKLAGKPERVVKKEKPTPSKGITVAKRETPVASKGKPERQREKILPSKGKSGRQAKKKEAENFFVEFLKEKPMHAAAVACIAIIAVALFFALSPKEGNIEDLWGDNGSQQQGEVKMIVLTSNRCPDCEDSSSLEMLFIANGVRYAVQEIEEGTEDGKKMIQAMGIEKLPAYIIDEKTIAGSVVVKTKSGFVPLKDVLHFYVNQGKGTYNEGIFVFPEMNLDEGQIKPMLLLGESCGSKQSFNIQLFLDPYDPNTIAKSKDLENLRGALRLDLDINVAFGYNYLPTYSQRMEKDYLALYGGKPEIVRENIEGAARYLICANDFGDDAFIKTERSIYATYCDVNWSVINLENPEPLWKCSDSNHFGIWVNGEELLLASRRADLEGNMLFDNCLYSAEQKMQNMRLLAETAGIDRTPAALVNCQYVVPIDKIMATACIINKDLRYC